MPERPVGRFERVEPLLGNFEACLRGFEEYSAFAGHPAVSHQRTLNIGRKAPHATAVLDDPAWYGSLITTLQDWNMDMRGASYMTCPPFSGVSPSCGTN